MTTLNASTSSGLIAGGNTDGTIQLQSNGTSIATISSSGLTMNSGNITVASTAAPAFSAYLSGAQSIPNSTTTVVAWNATSFDTASCFNTSTYRFTPNVAGYYLFTVNIQFSNAISSGEVNCDIQKNGSRAATVFDVSGGSTYYGQSASMLLYANGTTDYFNVTVTQLSGSSKNLNGNASSSFFQAFLARSA